MRYFSPAVLAFTALLTLASPAFAVSSTQTDYNSAAMDVAVNGTYAEAVSFDIPSTNIVLDSQQIRPGNTFTVTIPVSNSSDRPINVVVNPTTTGTGSSHLTVNGAGTATIAAGSSADIVYTFTFDSDTDAAQAGQTVNVTFNVQATGVYDPSSGNESF